MEDNVSLRTPARILATIVGILNVADMALHIAIDDVEPLRVAGNVVVIIAAIAVLAWAPARRAIVPIAAAVVILGLNLVFIALEGIGPLGAILVAATTLLLVGLALTLRRRG